MKKKSIGWYKMYSFLKGIIKRNNDSYKKITQNNREFN